MMRRLLVAVAGTIIATAAQAQSPRDGFYVGAHLGADWNHTTVTDTNGGVPPGPFDFSGRGYFGGVTLGYDKQVGCIPPACIILGVESDLGYASRLTSGVIASSNPIYHQDAKVGGGLYVDVAGRAGIAVGPFMVYGKGGVIALGSEGSQVTTKPGYTPTAAHGFPGVIYGGGIEQNIGHGWSVKVEYSASVLLASRRRPDERHASGAD